MNFLLELEVTSPNVDHLKPVLPNWWRNGLPAELVEFYSHYMSGADWVGETYIEIWSSQEIAAFNIRGFEYKDLGWDQFLFFATTGGGEEFGFCVKDSDLIYVVAPSISIDIDDVLDLGSFENFFSKLRAGTFLE